jgi:hypothetical protein
MRSGRALHLALVVTLVAVLSLAATGNARADGSWIDAPLQNWNTPGAAVPVAPMTKTAGNPSCANTGRPAETDEDFAVQNAGWTLVGGYQGGWGLVVLTGASGADGMCRPLDFQTFVFMDGQFAGTVSPVLMDSRTDGVMSRVDLGPGETPLTVTFSRYKPTDALCCPSSTSFVQYRVDSSSGVPVLVPVSAYTNPNAGG